MTKRKHFDAEREVRALTFDWERENRQLDLGPGHDTNIGTGKRADYANFERAGAQVEVDSECLIERVVVGPGASDDYSKAVDRELRFARLDRVAERSHLDEPPPLWRPPVDPW
jgi:hypothetical protein